MAPWFEEPWYDPARLPAQHMTMPMPAQGAAIEPVVLDPPGHDCRGEWGHLGPMDFGIRVSNIDAAAADLRADGIEVYGPPGRSTSAAAASGAPWHSRSRTATTSRSSRPATSVRLEPTHGLERGAQVVLTLDGRPVTAFEGESVAALLLAEGIVATRLTRGGEPRGVYCGMGVCFDCLVVVDGVPNTRACVTWVRRRG